VKAWVSKASFAIYNKSHGHSWFLFVSRYVISPAHNIDVNTTTHARNATIAIKATFSNDVLSSRPVADNTAKPAEVI
jgi:hypothetical protein